MPANSPIQEDTKFVPVLNTLAKTNTEEQTATKSGSVFFSRTALATAFTGVALAVTAYFSAPIAIAATFAIGVTASAYYGVTALVNYFKKSDTALTGTETQSNMPEADNAQSNTYSRVHQATHGTTTIKDKTTEDTKEEAKSEQLETTPVIKQDEQPSEKPVATQEQTDSHETTHSNSMN
jgi:hypothetical protein